ncbi:MAG: sensor histidine kinase [Thermodesulfobacteriota bacterium]
MSNYFPPPERTPGNQLESEINLIEESEIIKGLLFSLNGMIAVLDKNWHILTVNNNFFKIAGITDINEAIGLRPGEALKCIYSEKGYQGCGTSEYCSTCGAAAAISSVLSSNNLTAEKYCALTADQNGKPVNFILSVKARTINISDNLFILLFLQDVSAEQEKAALEKVFYHDLNNTLSALLGTSELLLMQNSDSKIINNLYNSSLKLKKEIEMHKSLLSDSFNFYSPSHDKVNSEEVIEDLKMMFLNHPESKDKTIRFYNNPPGTYFSSDLHLLLRVLGNMVVNALEATDYENEVKIWAELKNNTISFCTWNSEVIPEKISKRIFQRNFSTKKGWGRGLGTYSMKFFGEKMLKGRVDFRSYQNEGTIFSISLPLS